MAVAIEPVLTTHRRMSRSNNGSISSVHRSIRSKSLRKRAKTSSDIISSSKNNIATETIDAPTTYKNSSKL